jgi:hypothetical protein
MRGKNGKIKENGKIENGNFKMKIRQQKMKNKYYGKLIKKKIKI